MAIIQGAEFNQIGGPAPGAMNVISGNPKGGVGVAGTQTTKNTIGGNIIGTAADGSNNHVGNGIAGIVFDDNASGNAVRENQIKYNPDGVDNPGTKNKIYDPNSIFDNGYGIVNDTAFGTPVLNSAVASGTSLIVQGTVASTPNSSFLLEFFGNSIVDPVGHEQGEAFLGNLTVQTDANGNATFQTTLGSVYGVDVSATSTGVADDGGTSEFSNEVMIQLQTTTTSLTSNSNPSTIGQNVTFTAAVTSPQGGTPTGSVAFKDGNTNLGSAPVDGTGHATFSTALLSAGGHSISASYAGDVDYAGSASAAIDQTVNGPAVTGLSPSTGSTSGGYNVQIHGSGFTGATNVAFGGSSAGLFTVVSDGQINVTVPTLQPAGTVNVRVTTPNGTSAISANDWFTFTSP